MCADKSNEPGTLPQLLALLELKGAVISIDAMGTHPDIAAQIHEAGGDYILALKANQKSALTTVAARFAELDAAAGYDAAALAAGEHPGHLLPPGPLPAGASVSLSHGRCEQRPVMCLRIWSSSPKAGDGLLRDHLPKKSIRSKRKLAAMDPTFRTDLLASIAHNFRA